MNKQGPNGIPYCDYTWNPITGCLHDCPYCYARGIANRFHGGFAPAYHPERLDEPKRVHKPSTIFLGDMGDAFGDWLPREQIETVLQVIRETPWHRYLLLTKNPKRYQEFDIPGNAWIGTTVEDNSKRWRIDEMLKAKATLYFVSGEPLLGALDVKHYGPSIPSWTGRNSGLHPILAKQLEALPDIPPTPGISWLIVGAQSGPNAVQMDEDWVRRLRDQCAEEHIAFFYKQNVVKGERIRMPLLDGKAYREIPAGRLLDGREHSELPEVTPHA